MLSVAVLGASGYTGVELVRLLLGHPTVQFAALAAEKQAGKHLAEVFPAVSGVMLPRMEKIEAVNFSDIDAVFCCLPHAATQAVVKNLPENLVIIDLSADFRLRDVAMYAEWYGTHQAPALQPEAVYGLSEFARDAVKKARLIANPGCYPTAAQLALLPLISERVIDWHDIVIDAKSGVSGAGRSLRESSLAAEVQEGFTAYGLEGHRHRPEIEQELSLAAGAPVTVTFAPHLLPMNRGILETIYLRLTAGCNLDDARQVLEQRYADEAFVQVLPVGQTASTRHVRGSNMCHLSLHPGRTPGQIIVCSAIDNLIKGASGQAVQNLNIRFGFAETTALGRVGVFP
ncbi:MAG: N-acetyl-gamma-glutamyl-phosphate reductase [Holosporales bacterium]